MAFLDESGLEALVGHVKSEIAAVVAEKSHFDNLTVENDLSIGGDIFSDGNPVYGAKVLYDNASGTTGTITLAETAANFVMLEVFYLNDLSGTNVHQSERIYNPNGKYITFSSTGYVDSLATIQHSFVSALISGTTVTQTGEFYINATVGKTTVTPNTAPSSARHNRIYCIVGYR